MNELSQRTELLFELEDRLRACLAQGLEGDEGFAFAVVGFLHHTHATGADASEDSEALGPPELQPVIAAQGALPGTPALTKARHPPCLVAEVTPGY